MESFLRENSKNLAVVAFEVAAIFLMVFNIWPREAVILVTGFLICYFIFSPLKDSLWVFLVSLPLFLALPLTSGFDSMANWRILVVVLFLVWFFKKIKEEGLDSIWPYIKEKIKNKAIVLFLIFIGISFLSLLVAEDVGAGLKRIAFLINIAMIFLVIEDVIVSEKSFKKIFQGGLISLGLVLAVGYLQLISIFIVSLYNFWFFWAGRVIPLFYGDNLGKLLLDKNTWFSYYHSAPPTLRMFSVFPDSHSFALFIIVGVPYILALIYTLQPRKKSYLFFLYGFLVLALAGLLFSGSRGVWLSALVPLFILLTLLISKRFSYFSFLSKVYRFFIRFFEKIKSNFWRIGQLIVGSLILLFILFPLVSDVFFISQESQLGIYKSSNRALFERARSIFDFSELSVKSRLQIWNESLNSVWEHPWLGVGIGNYPVVLNQDIEKTKEGSSAHNLYLDIASEVGLVALMVFIGLMVVIFKNTWQAGQNKTGLAGALASVFSIYLIWILSYSLFDVVLFNDKVLIFFVITVGLIYGAKKSLSFNNFSDI